MLSVNYTSIKKILINKELIPILHKLKTEKEGTLPIPSLTYKTSTILIVKPKSSQELKKKKRQSNSSCEYGHKNPWHHGSKRNPATYKKGYTSRSDGIYPKNAMLVQHTNISQCRIKDKTIRSTRQTQKSITQTPTRFTIKIKTTLINSK